MRQKVKIVLDWILDQEGDNLWRLGKAVHEALDAPMFWPQWVLHNPRLAYWHPFALVWHVWWRVGYHWVYPFMRDAKARGKSYAQWFGEGYPPHL